MIVTKDQREIELMREAGYMVSKTHKYLKPFIKEGITTKELDRLAEEYIRSMGGVPTCKGFESQYVSVPLMISFFIKLYEFNLFPGSSPGSVASNTPAAF